MVVRLCSCTCIRGVVLILLRFCPHVVSRLFPCFLYWGFVLIFYFEALSSYYIEALSSHFIWGLGLVYYFEASSLYFILRLRPHCFILRHCSSIWGFGPHCFRPLLLCLYCLFGLFAVICVWFCLFVFLSRVTRRQYYLVWIFTFYVYFLVFIRTICYFGLHAATLILISGFVGFPGLICVDIIVLCLLWWAIVMC